MVYRLKNWQFARDMMCSAPDTILGLIIQILDEMKINYDKSAIEERLARKAAKIWSLLDNSYRLGG